MYINLSLLFEKYGVDVNLIHLSCEYNVDIYNLLATGVCICWSIRCSHYMSGRHVEGEDCWIERSKQDRTSQVILS